MEVCFLASGERVAAFDADEFEGKSAKTLKQTLAARIGISRFRQRLFLEGDSREIPDDEVFASVPAKVQLVVLDFLPPDSAADGALVFLSKSNNLHGLNYLLQCPRDPNVKDTLGRTPLSFAAEQGHVGSAGLLLEAGAAPDQARRDGATPLLVAAEGGHVDVARFLLEAGAAPEQARKDGATPLLVAAERGHLDVARLLLETGAAPDQATTACETPLLVAAERGHVDIARLLLEAGAAPDLVGKDGVTPLLMAILRRHRDVVELLLESGANVKITRDVASRFGSTEVSAYLDELESAFSAASKPDDDHDVACAIVIKGYKRQSLTDFLVFWLASYWDEVQSHGSLTSKVLQ